MKGTALAWMLMGLVVFTTIVAAQAAPDQDIGEFIEALRDVDPFVRATAAFALGRMGPAARDAIPALVEALRDEDEDVRDAAAGYWG